MFWDNLIKLCADRQTTPTKAITSIGLSKGSITAWKAGRIPSDTVLRRIADYFGVTVDYLLGKEEKKPADDTASEEEVKVALFGGAEEVTDEMWEEVKRFAEFIKQKYKK